MTLTPYDFVAPAVRDAALKTEKAIVDRVLGLVHAGTLTGEDAKTAWLQIDTLREFAAGLTREQRQRQDVREPEVSHGR